MLAVERCFLYEFSILATVWIILGAIGVLQETTGLSWKAAALLVTSDFVAYVCMIPVIFFDGAGDAIFHTAKQAGYTCTFHLNGAQRCCQRVDDIPAESYTMGFECEVWILLGRKLDTGAPIHQVLCARAKE